MVCELLRKRSSHYATFVMNKGVGKFSYKTKDTHITGTMDEDGFIHGDLVWLEQSEGNIDL